MKDKELNTPLFLALILIPPLICYLIFDKANEFVGYALYSIGSVYFVFGVVLGLRIPLRNFFGENTHMGIIGSLGLSLFWWGMGWFSLNFAPSTF